MLAIKKTKQLRKTAESKIELYLHGAICDELLKHTVDIKFYRHNKYERIPGTLAKHFVCDKPGCAYPLLKNTQLDADSLRDISVYDILIRFLRSARNIIFLI